MTRDDYEKYKKLNDEIENIKTFLFYCGKRYRCKLLLDVTYSIYYQLNFLINILDYVTKEYLMI